MACGFFPVVPTYIYRYIDRYIYICVCHAHLNTVISNGNQAGSYILYIYTANTVRLPTECDSEDRERIDTLSSHTRTCTSSHSLTIYSLKCFKNNIYWIRLDWGYCQLQIYTHIVSTDASFRYFLRYLVRWLTFGVDYCACSGWCVWCMDMYILYVYRAT